MYCRVDATDGRAEPETFPRGREGCTFYISYPGLMLFQELFSGLIKVEFHCLLTTSLNLKEAATGAMLIVINAY